ncbi:GNAT family N-acetyltransferase [Evansella tamaricis]|uniref:GNAT family N-acetyltransferase n=1 Tax=Evansella tamaricis TaxID=2069301 RepID=A0ABS6JG03_9BACI|nr:GNAT family N-acetyltransferase [Evansella tamaricis]MBU9712600.1 GNAT family N-acetyltransferase [Evansella tamaricis]
MIEISQLTSVEEMKRIQTLERLIWNMDPLPYHQTLTVSKNGGLLLGAFDGEELVGFSYGFPGWKDGKVYLCSHMLGILPNYQKGGLGRQLKEKQRSLALSMGFDLITWTFDPLESVNAYLNLHKLKGLGASYIENYYGELDDSLNNGLPSDRFLVEWWIDSPYVDDMDLSETESSSTESIGGKGWLFQPELSKSGYPIPKETNGTFHLDPNVDEYFLPIPQNFQSIKLRDGQLAADWRFISRDWINTLMENGFVAVDLDRKGASSVGCSLYIFKRRDSLFINCKDK